VERCDRRRYVSVRLSVGDAAALACKHRNNAADSYYRIYFEDASDEGEREQQLPYLQWRAQREEREKLRASASDGAHSDAEDAQDLYAFDPLLIRVRPFPLWTIAALFPKSDASADADAESAEQQEPQQQLQKLKRFVQPRSWTCQTCSWARSTLRHVLRCCCRSWRIFLSCGRTLPVRTAARLRQCGCWSC
jgi:hypothetical protein